MRKAAQTIPDNLRICGVIHYGKCTIKSYRIAMQPKPIMLEIDTEVEEARHSSYLILPKTYTLNCCEDSSVFPPMNVHMRPVRASVDDVCPTTARA